MKSLISKFKALALFKKQGLHQEVADLLRSMTNDEVKGLYRFLNETYQESTEDANYLTLDDICYFSTIRATIIISDPGDEQESIERDLDDIMNTSKQ
jgi:hypothetical protein